MFRKHFPKLAAGAIGSFGLFGMSYLGYQALKEEDDRFKQQHPGKEPIYGCTYYGPDRGGIGFKGIRDSETSLPAPGKK